MGRQLTLHLNKANPIQLVYGNFAGSFTSFSVDAVAIEHFKKQTDRFTLYYVYLGK